MANWLNSVWVVMAIAGAALCLALGVLWLALLLRTRAKLKAMEDSMKSKK